jgi:hypothetical protein
MSVSQEYINNLVAQLDADKEERERKPEFALGEPVMVVYGVGINYEGEYRHFSKREDAEAFMLADGADYVEEIKIY